MPPMKPAPEPEDTPSVRVSANGQSALVLVVDRKVFLETEGTRISLDVARTVAALSGDWPLWLTVAQAVQAGLDADPVAQPRAVMNLATNQNRLFFPLTYGQFVTWEWHVLAHDRYWYVRAAVAERAKRGIVPDAVVDLLAADPKPGVRSRLARHLVGRRDIFDAFTKDRAYEVRIALAENPAIPARVRATLAADAEHMVRYANAYAPATQRAVDDGLLPASVLAPLQEKS